MAAAKKPPAKTPAKTQVTASTPGPSLEEIEDKRARNRVAKLRERFSKAVDDPQARAQMVRTLRAMMQDE